MRFPKPTRPPKRQRDPVTPELRARVLARDGGCVAATLDVGHVCRDRWGWPHHPARVEAMTLDHVQEGYGRMGIRAPSDTGHLVTLCWHAHLDGWATSNRPALRAYIASKENTDGLPERSDGHHG